MKVGDTVHDVGYPWRLGRVVRRLKTRTHVRWTDDGRVDSYDKPHERRFLRVVDRGRRR